MAITKLDFPTASTPSYTPTLAGDYNDQNEYIERNARGYNAVSLTNWDATTTKPQIAAGSVIEINGSTWDITTNTDIDTSGASSGTIYVYFDDGTPEFKFLDTAPAWSATLNGWYTSGDRFTGHSVTWDGASAYSAKTARMNDHSDDANSTDGLFTPLWALGAESYLTGLKTKDMMVDRSITCHGIITDQSSATGSSNDYGIKWTKISGTLDGGGALTAAHGMTFPSSYTDIVGIYGSVFDTGTSRVYSLDSVGTVYLTSTNFVITTGGAYAGDTFVIIVVVGIASNQWPA